jgi:23S rRNA (adenine2503-C2)-methyltransferase
VPAGKKWPLQELMAACRTYSAATGRKIFYEWTLIEGKNDSPEHARAIGRLLNGLPAQVNLIPLNPTVGYGGAPRTTRPPRNFSACSRMSSNCRAPCASGAASTSPRAAASSQRPTDRTPGSGTRSGWAATVFSLRFFLR